jgi:chorismate lyase / 3-hydroxybenzoate synthase
VSASRDPKISLARVGETGLNRHVGALPVDVQYVTTAQLAGLDAERVFGAVFFGMGDARDARFPTLHVDMRQVSEPAVAEVWVSDAPVIRGSHDGIAHAQNDDVLFGFVHLGVSPDDAIFEDRVNEIYARIFELLEARGYPHLIRVWNYFPQITHESVGLENYQRFCRGRGVAFQARYGEFEYRLPSASAVGARSGGLALYFIAARAPGHQRENPRQVSAYHYPPQYGPRSPSFARATLKRWGSEALLFISGTASIVGHESRHVGDLAAQIEETLRNLDTLIVTTGAEEGVPFAGLQDMTHIKVYLRDPAFFGVVNERVRAAFGPSASAILLHGDVCRTDLLVEIEGVARVRIA